MRYWNGKNIIQIIDHGHDGIFGESKPEMMGDDLWEMVRMCWTMDCSQRPSMAMINGKLARMLEAGR
jgi:hypothetical protein